MSLISLPPNLHVLWIYFLCIFPLVTANFLKTIIFTLLLDHSLHIWHVYITHRVASARFISLFIWVLPQKCSPCWILYCWSSTVFYVWEYFNHALLFEWQLAGFKVQSYFLSIISSILKIYYSIISYNLCCCWKVWYQFEFCSLITLLTLLGKL